MYFNHSVHTFGFLSMILYLKVVELDCYHNSQHEPGEAGYLLLCGVLEQN